MGEVEISWKPTGEEVEPGRSWERRGGAGGANRVVPAQRGAYPEWRHPLYKSACAEAFALSHPGSVVCSSVLGFVFCVLRW